MTSTSNTSTPERAHRVRWYSALTTAAVAVVLAAGCGSSGDDRDADVHRSAPAKAAGLYDQAQSRGAYGY